MFVICGAGITGLTIARELVRRGISDILILEKEGVVGKHASGRNSGVLHAGIYYSPDSLKARFAVEGNRLMKEYVKERGLPIRETGKVVVARRPEEIEVLYELKRRADAAGSRAEIVDERTLGEIEPHARTHEKALYTPLTAVIDPISILESMVDELRASGRVEFRFGEACAGHRGGEIITHRSRYPFDFFINAAGAHADRIAHSFSLARDLLILPFRGTYRRLRDAKSHLVRGNIYPVPDLRSPFLGVHFTKGVDGTVYAGPTAFPALGREHYGFLPESIREAVSILYRDAVMFFRNPPFRYNAMREILKYIPGFFYRDAASLLRGLERGDLIPSRKVGIRPQLVNWKTKELVMDFVVLKDGNTLHILNAISPAFTTSMAFARWVVDEFVQM